MELNFFLAYHSRTAAGACHKMGSCSKLSLNSSNPSIIAHEPAIMGVETCSNDVDQYALCWSTNDHGKPRGTLLPNAVYRHGCLYTSGCRLALVILLFYALFFQAAVAQNTSEWYPGWGRTLINNSASTNSSTYYYYPLQEGMEFSPRSFVHLWLIFREAYSNTCNIHRSTRIFIHLTTNIAAIYDNVSSFCRVRLF